MAFHPFDVSIPHIVYAALGGFVVLFGMFSLLVREKLYIGEAPLAFVFGVIIGPNAANIFDPRSWGGGSEETVNSITLEVTRVILAVGVFAIGVELPKQYMKRHWKSLFFLLIPVMSWGWIVSAGLIFALVPGLNFLSSLAVAACLTPTDPILAAAVVGGKYADKHVPAHLRHLLAAESGCNDGAAFPFLYFALYLVTENSTKHAIQDWFLITWFYEILFGTVFGALIGFAFRYLMKFCERNDLIDRQSYVAQYVSLAMFTIGVTTMLGSDDLLAAFACGTAFAWDGFFNKQTEQSVFSSVIDLLFNIAAFVFIGAWMPFDSFNDPNLTLSVWRLIVIAILVLLLRRLPVILALYRWIPDVKTFREAVFSGHFGPIGVGAVFISTLATELLVSSEKHSNQSELLQSTIQPIVAFMVLCSITIHGLSIPFFSLSRRVHSVTRTWSRHQSTDFAPEWATHTRRAHRPEDIIINRDSVLERGQLGVDDEKIDAESGTVRTSSKDSDDQGVSVRPGAGTGIDEVGVPVIRTQAPSPEMKEKAKETQSDILTLPTSVSPIPRQDNPPDGEEVVAAWPEGRDIVLEKRAGPGEEVQVDVLRDALEPSSGAGSSGIDLKNLGLSHGGRLGTGFGEVEEKFKKRVRHALEEFDSSNKHPSSSANRQQQQNQVSDSDEDGIQRLRMTLRRAGDEARNFVQGSSGEGSGDGEGSGEGAVGRGGDRHVQSDDEEGWMSDRSIQSPRQASFGTAVSGGVSTAAAVTGSSTEAQAENERGRSKSPRKKHKNLNKLTTIRQKVLGGSGSGNSGNSTNKPGHSHSYSESHAHPKSRHHHSHSHSHSHRYDASPSHSEPGSGRSTPGAVSEPEGDDEDERGRRRGFGLGSGLGSNPGSHPGSRSGSAQRPGYSHQSRLSINTTSPNSTLGRHGHGHGHGHGYHYPRHQRIESLRSPASAAASRSASPARSVRFADEGGYHVGGGGSSSNGHGNGHTGSQTHAQSPSAVSPQTTSPSSASTVAPPISAPAPALTASPRLEESDSNGSSSATHRVAFDLPADHHHRS